MSARPRPVTATFPPTPLLSPVHLRPRSRTPSPLNSTASLLSVLNHNSYESSASPVTRFDSVSLKAKEEKSAFTEHYFAENSFIKQFNSDEEPLTTFQHSDSFIQNLKNCNPVVSAATSLKEIKQSEPVDTAKVKSAQMICVNQSLEKSTPNKQKLFEDGCKVIDKEASNELSAWEKWIIQKAKENRSKAEQEMKQQQMKLKEEEIIQKKNEDKKKENERVFTNWIKKHDHQKIQEINAEKQKGQDERELKEKNKKLMSEKASAKFKEWLEKKVKEEIKMKKEIAGKKAEELAVRENRHRRSEEAFNEWFRKAQSRPRTAPHSYGYTDGRLTGYYDAGAYPIPTYINPMPWKPNEVSRPKSLVKKKKKQFQQNILLSKNMIQI